MSWAWVAIGFFGMIAMAAGSLLAAWYLRMRQDMRDERLRKHEFALAEMERALLHKKIMEVQRLDLTPPSAEQKVEEDHGPVVADWVDE